MLRFRADSIAPLHSDALSVIVSSIKTAEPLVALTFDDGPHEKYTTLLLDVLDSESVPATFFIRGSALNAKTRPIVMRMTTAGHEVGNHTHNHRDLATADPATIHEEIARTHYELAEITSHAPTLLRPPYGHGFEQANTAAELLDYRATVLWSAWGHDWEDPQPPADLIAKRVLTGYGDYAGVDRGGIVLLHDSSSAEPGASRRETVEATRALIPALHAGGLRLVTVSELIDAAESA